MPGGTRIRRGMGRDDLVTSNGDGGPILRFAKRYAVAAAGALYAFTLGVGDARNRHEQDQHAPSQTRLRSHVSVTELRGERDGEAAPQSSRLWDWIKAAF